MLDRAGAAIVERGGIRLRPGDLTRLIYRLTYMSLAECVLPQIRTAKPGSATMAAMVASALLVEFG